MANIEQIDKFAREIAVEHDVRLRRYYVKRRYPRLDDDNKVLVETYKLTNEIIKQKGDTIGAAEWLLDNFYIIEEHVKEVEHSLPRNFYRDLPVLCKGSLSGYPRVYGIAHQLVELTDGRIEEEIILSFLKEYQTVTPLTSGELWAVPMMLKITLIQKIRDIALYINDSIKERRQAEYWAEKLIKAIDEEVEGLSRIIERHDNEIGFIKPTYAERLLQRLREQGVDAAPVIRWVDGKLAVQNTDADEIIQLAHQEQAAKQVTMGNAVTSLRLISGLKWEEIYEEVSLVEANLRKDPAGVYPIMEFASRDYYRHNIEKIAKRFDVSEISVAEKAVECAAEQDEDADSRYRHVGYYIIDKGIDILEQKLREGRKLSFGIKRAIKRNPKAFYFGTIIAFTAILTLIFSALVYFLTEGSIGWVVVTTVVAFIPLITIVVGLLHWLITRMLKPRHMPKIELKDGIDPEHRTMVIIPTLLTSPKRVLELIEQMEVFYLANQEENLHFALVGDYKDGPDEKTPTDDEIVQTGIDAINELNEKYSQEGEDIFFFFHRHRVWNEAQNSWMGWERKRGAITEFNELLRGNKDTSYTIQTGDTSILKNIKYVITLDADTQLPRDAAKRLIGAMIHPLNLPVLDETGTKVIDGYGLLQPRIGISVDSASRSYFALTFSGQTGVDPYTCSVSDVYQDLFGKGIFTGKGIYNVDVFNKVLGRNIPENSVLSHDLLEGSYIRAGLATDIELIDGYPAHYVGHAMRLHRWVRGDWQLIPWLKKYIRNGENEKVRNPIDSVAKWQILDNFRRSLLSPALFLLFVLSLFISPKAFPVLMGLAIITLVFPLLTEVVGTALNRFMIRGYKRARLINIFYGAKSLARQIVLTFVFLAHQAYLMSDAVLRTLWRVYISHKNMLEWVTAADSERRVKGSHGDYWNKVKASPIMGAILIVLMVIALPDFWYIGIIMSAIWIAAPYVAYKVSKPKGKKTPVLSQEQTEKLRYIARKTWRYFDQFVNRGENWLPPDNYQQEPPVGIAHRTSPTNIGLLLLSTMAAWDLGYIGTIELIERISNTVGTMERLQKWQGHYYNWYDTRTLEPLKPRYVSTVDNGNLVSYLITLNQGIEELMDKPLFRKECLQGIKDVLKVDCNKESLDEFGLLNMLLSSEKVTITEWKVLLDDCMDVDPKLDRVINTHYNDLNKFAPWAESLTKIPPQLLGEKGSYSEVSKKLVNLLEKLDSVSSIKGLYTGYHEILKSLSETIGALRKNCKKASGYAEAKKWLSDLELSLAGSYSFIRTFISRCSKLRDTVSGIIEEMDFKLLYDKNKELFSIGYDVEEGQLSKSFYDLLASEARQASFVAIAKGDVPQKHWFKLGRSLSLVGDLRVLLSWSGTMFEYLMPLLIMRNYDYTLLDETYTAVIGSQKHYMEQHHLPWGVSESGFYAFDLHLNYQYKAFGVPQLGLKRGLVNDLVVAPYATLLALQVEPVYAYKNIEALLNEGMDGPYGLYEAIDFTPERLPKKRKSMIVKSFMAHHQGMGLVAINNYLNDNIMQKRFHSVPIVKATELMLQEKMPQKAIFIKEYEEDNIIEIKEIKQQEIRARRRFTTPDTSIPETNLLSNGSYTVMLTNSGNGYSQFQGQAVTRFRSDSTEDPWGMIFYIHNLNSNTFWSTAYKHCSGGQEPEEYEVLYEPDRVEYRRRDGSIETKTEVVVSPEYNGEVRRITLTNHGESGRVMEVTSYAEIVLGSLEGDKAHPAFSNLFVQTDYLREYNAIIATRRKREKKEKPLWLVHFLTTEGESMGSVQYETDRSKFIGRGRNKFNPQALDPEFPLSDTVGPVLDPIISIRKRMYVPAGQPVRLSFITAVADSKEAVMTIARECQSPASAERAIELAWTHSQVELRYLNMSANQANLYQRIASHIIYSSPTKKQWEEHVIRNRKGQQGLWNYGISGDLPILMVRVRKSEHMDMVKQILTAHEYWRLKGLYVDLVLLNEYGNSYEQPIQDQLRDIISISHARDLQDKPGGVFPRQSATIPEEDLDLLYSVAGLILDGDNGSIASQLMFSESNRQLPALLNPPQKSDIDENSFSEIDSLGKDLDDLMFFNGIGGFNKDGSEYVIYLKNKMVTPLPWSNIVANPGFGFLITESGSSYTWCENSRENKLTPWSNDPVVDPSGEVLYLRNEDTGAYWTITPRPKGYGSHLIRHGKGYSTFENISHGLKQSQTLFVPLDDPIKIVKVELENLTESEINLSMFYYAEWLLGVNKNSPFIVSEYDDKLGCLYAYNRYNSEFGSKVAFLAGGFEAESYTCDKSEFIGRNRDITLPASMERNGLSGRTGIFNDPCGAIQLKLPLKPRERKEVLFFLGQCNSKEEIESLLTSYRNKEKAEEAYQGAVSFWEDKLSVISVKTPDKTMDLMLNKWLLYQAYACRIMARTAFYQAGGAFGFRDQLQDCLALIYSFPERIREHIIYSAAHQFREGDVQHWWHPPNRGVRTKITDDLLFLPFVMTDYISATGDWSILDEKAPYLVDDPLGPDEHDRYNSPGVSEEEGDIYEHCTKAIDRALDFGERGLPLIGGGDWNDGMDKVGIEGKGESVWLGWFLYTVLNRFIPVCYRRNDQERAKHYEEKAKELLENIEKNGWDGGWYRRAYFDDGTPLGSEINDECRIDSISQSWAVISGGAKESRVKSAMKAVENYLVSREDGLIKLLMRPFYQSELEPGYIKGYVPGIRENGGQYTHAAVWTILAFALLGEGDKAMELYHMINPINHTRTSIELWRYKAEPYVIAADVYAVPPHTGRGGWTWYTGSASWMYRVGIEHLLGFKLSDKGFTVEPCIPTVWKEYEIQYRHKDTVYNIRVTNPHGASKGVVKVLMDGNALDDKVIPFVDDGKVHNIEVEMGSVD